MQFVLALATAAVLAATPPARAAEPGSWHPDSIAWQRTNPDGTRFALLEGRRDCPATAFTYAFFIPAGVWDGPHSHTLDARVFVARGTLRLGYGDTLERGKAVAYPAGSYVLVPGGKVHFDGSDEDTVIIGTATGVWGTTYLKDGTPSAGSPPR